MYGNCHSREDCVMELWTKSPYHTRYFNYGRAQRAIFLFWFSLILHALLFTLREIYMSWFFWCENDLNFGAQKVCVIGSVNISTLYLNKKKKKNNYSGEWTVRKTVRSSEYQSNSKALLTKSMSSNRVSANAVLSGNPHRTRPHDIGTKTCSTDTV